MDLPAGSAFRMRDQDATCRRRVVRDFVVRDFVVRVMIRDDCCPPSACVDGSPLVAAGAWATPRVARRSPGWLLPSGESFRPAGAAAAWRRRLRGANGCAAIGVPRDGCGFAGSETVTRRGLGVAPAKPGRREGGGAYSPAKPGRRGGAGRGESGKMRRCGIQARELWILTPDEICSIAEETECVSFYRTK